jgi:ribonuclease HII
MTLVAGIDESGRGPVIGPLIMAGVLINEEDSARLKSLGVKDSKLLTPEQRLYLEKGIKKIAQAYKVIKVPPKEIDYAVEGHDGLNLNWLEAKKVAEVINTLKPEKAIIDCPSPNLKAYSNYIKKHLDHPDIELVVAHKADRDFFEVGAASVLAKNAREKEVEKIEKQLKQKIGSGYMTNPVCQEFVKKNFDKHPELFRKSWSTFKRQVEAKQQKKLGDY